jgi:hypothetical protein
VCVCGVEGVGGGSLVCVCVCVRGVYGVCEGEYVVCICVCGVCVWRIRVSDTSPDRLHVSILRLRSDQISSVQFRKNRSGQVRSGQVRSGQVRPGQASAV